MFKEMTKIQQALSAIVAILIIAFSFDAIYARNSKLDLLAMRLDKKIEADQRADVRKQRAEEQTQIWRLEDRYKCHTYDKCCDVMNKTDKAVYRNLIEKLKPKE